MSLLPEVREELLATAARQAAEPQQHRRRSRSASGSGAVALGVACAVAVVAVAVLALRHRASGPTNRSTPAGSSLAALEARLAVLRRPQTAADRTALRYFLPRARSLPVGPIAGLTRLAATITTPTTGRLRVYLTVVRLRSKPWVFAAAVAFDQKGQNEGTSGSPTGSALAPNAVSAGAQIKGLGPDPDRGVSVGVVPDGVTRVKWTFTGAGYGILDPRPVTVYPEVQGNVAEAPVVPGQGPLAAAVWYGAGGRVIAAAGEGPDTRLRLAQIDAVNASRHRPIDPMLTAHYRLFRSVAPQDLARDPVLPTAGAGGGGDLNYWQTRFIGSVTGLDGSGLWVTPGDHHLSISDWNAGEYAGLTSRELSVGILGGSTSNGRESTITGLVPDGNRTVTVVLAGGARETFPVLDNVYEVTVRGRIVAIINRDVAGRLVRTPLG